MSTTETQSLADALPKEIQRVQELIPLYESVGPSGQFAVAMMKGDIREAQRAMMAGDVVAMVRVYQSLKETTA